MVNPLLSLDEARRRLLAGAGTLGTERLPLDDALGRVLAEEVAAYRAQPPSALSAMDGYAIRKADLPGPFKLVGEAPAGAPYEGALSQGETVRIFTGGVVPASADKVVVQEIVREEDGQATLTEEPSEASFIRPAGLDFGQGDAVLKPGTLLTPAALALAAAANHAELCVTTKPRIAIVSSGDELVPPGGEPQPAEIIDAASYGIAAFIRQWGGEVTRRLHLRDDLAAVTEAARRLADEADLIVTIGGASVGAKDLLRAAFQEAGAEERFAGIDVRPGKPFWHARAGRTLIAGLPGNPASAMVTARLLVAPLIGTLTGRGSHVFTESMRAPLAAALPPPGMRTTWHRAAMAEGELHIDPHGDSALLTPLAAASCLVCQPGDTPLAEGTLAEALPL
ncbi:molybdopterin molybdotransferase MoeA [Parvularcula maris]|uniref:Molybdopterin molybdenumtransferase n=1 Tax=Parvularcula maris TaxID=2965077 RepID=A0A9X2L898_9PROT|nr:molybdopterin molybdotransferase MoeA [Parvularcula maris]MCQ8184857.1 molybdopterin molybdotransferase MoeA [Parvularcula maris]